MQTWASAHDALKDIEYADEMDKDGVYDAAFAKQWEMAWEIFMTKTWAWLLKDAQKNLEVGKITQEQHRWWILTDVVLKELKEMGMTMEMLQDRMKELKDAREDEQKDSP